MEERGIASVLENSAFSRFGDPLCGLCVAWFLRMELSQLSEFSNDV